MSGRSGSFPVSYEDAKARFTQVRPSVRLGRKLSIDGSESVPGQRYVLHIREGGDPKGGRQTTIEVAKASETSCWVSVHSWSYNMVFPSHKAWHTERKRWREVKRLLNPI